jgi:hypothetical protein
MNRRDFLGCTAGLLVLPNVKLKRDDFEIKLLPYSDDWLGQRVEIRKGDHVFRCNACLEDLRDCHNICATDEMVMIAVQELELGKKNLHLLYSTWHDFDDEGMRQRKELVESLRVYHLTREEKTRIYKLMRKLRGKHDCCGPRHHLWW